MALLAQLRDLYRALRQGVHVPLEDYFSSLPTMPDGLTAKDLKAAGFPKTDDLLDGILIGLGLTILRVILTHFVFDPCGRVGMKHRTGGFKHDAKVDAFLG